MAEVGKEFTSRLDMGDAESIGGSWGIGAGEDIMTRVEGAFEDVSHSGSLHQAVVAALVELHSLTKEVSEQAASSLSSTSRTYLSPRYVLCRTLTYFGHGILTFIIFLFIGIILL